MEAPDKIYIDDLAVINDCITKISLKRLPNFSGYIRTDTLLKKLNRAIELRIKSGINETSDGIMTLKTIIEYIKSL